MERITPLFVVLVSMFAPGRSSDPYDRGLAQFMLDMTDSSYCTAEELTDWGCPACRRGYSNISLDSFGLPEVQVFKGKVGGFGKVKDLGTQAVVAALPIGAQGGQPMDAPIGIVVAFRGTVNAANIIEDLLFSSMTPEDDIYKLCPDCKVHKGFYDAWVSVAAKVCEAVRLLRKTHPFAAIYVTGHSLGAAMAALAAVHFYFGENMPVRYVYTFGQPRVGNKAFHHFYNNGTSNNPINGTSYRVTHWKDPVPHGPFQDMGYHHTATEVFYNANSTSYKVCNGTGEDPECSRQFKITDCLRHTKDHMSYLGQSMGYCN